MKMFSDDPKQAMSEVVELMRAMSSQTDPQKMLLTYRDRVKKLTGYEHTISLSRRDLSAPWYRITRSTLWKEDINPWTQKDRLPLHNTGILGELLYGDQPRILDNFVCPPSDPAYEMLKDYHSLFAIPHYDHGVGINMVVSLKREPGGFDVQSAPALVWLSNLFGRATHSLVMAQQLKTAYDQIDRELKAVSEIQRSLLPAVLPDVHGLQLAVHYQTSQQAGGDYYDLFPLPDGRLGMLIADVSGHGTPAAVLMAITHTVAHSFPGTPESPAQVLAHLNNRLTDAYSRTPGGFVTAFYGVFDPQSRLLTYAGAGHNPPRVRRGISARTVDELASAREMPLGIAADVRFTEATARLSPGDLLLMYTDGVTEARKPQGGAMFGESRLDETLSKAPEDPGWTISKLVEAVESFTEHAPASDDRTLVAARVV